jgi:fructose-bisphosphate aldolase, class I
MVYIQKVLRDGRALLFDFDSGFTEGPKAFNIHSIDPSYVVNIAAEGQYTAALLHAGLTERYATQDSRTLPVIVKLNTKTALPSLDPAGSQVCSVPRAIELRADAVCFTLYNTIAFKELDAVLQQAREYRVPVILQYTEQGDSDKLAYVARIALELSADAIILPYNNDKQGFEWVVKAAGRTKVFAYLESAGKELLQHAHEAVLAGATGVVVGKSVWTQPKPFTITRALHAVVFKEKTVEEASKFLE